MLQFQLNRPYFPRCLVDGRILWFRTRKGKQKKTITCPKCFISYSRATIKDSHRERWNTVRAESLYMAKRDSNGRIILYPQGLV